MWSIIPLLIAWWLRHLGPLSLPPNAKLDLQVFFSGLYSESFFNAHRAEFFAAFASFLRLNRCLVLRLYSIVLIASLSSNLLIIRYGRIRQWLSGQGKPWLPIRWLFFLFILPRISEWHLILSPVLLPSKRMNIEIDVLTKCNVLYSGRLTAKALSASGELESLTLGSPRRFRREHYWDARKSDPNVKSESFWTPIPSQLFVILASDISTLNIRHIPENLNPYGEKFKDIAEALKSLEQKIHRLKEGEPNLTTAG